MMDANGFSGFRDVPYARLASVFLKRENARTDRTVMDIRSNEFANLDSVVRYSKLYVSSRDK